MNNLTRSNYLVHLRVQHPETLALNLDHSDRGARDCVSWHQWLAAWVTKSWIAYPALVSTITCDEARPPLHLPIGGPPARGQAYFWPPNMLFNILIAHLAAFRCSGAPVAACSCCGALHPRTRKARADQPTYCDACRIEARRKSNRESIARVRAQRRAHG